MVGIKLYLFLVLCKSISASLAYEFQFCFIFMSFKKNIEDPLQKMPDREITIIKRE